MKIVVLDGYTLNPGDISWEGMERFGEVTVYVRTKEEDIVSRIGDAEAVYTNKTPLTRETFDACPNIKFVGVLATGYNIVDIAAAKEKNIPVSNIPTYGTAAVSQYAIALLLELCHHIGEHSDCVKKGDWTNNAESSSCGACRKDYGNHRVRAHRAGYGKDCTGAWHEGSCLRCIQTPGA